MIVSLAATLTMTDNEKIASLVGIFLFVLGWVMGGLWLIEGPRHKQPSSHSQQPPVQQESSVSDKSHEPTTAFRIID